MFIHRWGAGLVIVLLLAPAAQAQVANDRTSEDTAQAAGSRQGKSPDLRRVEQLIVEMTNRFRREQGRGELRRNPKLAEAACDFAGYMAEKNKFSHTADDHQPWERTAARGYQDCIVAENIAWEMNTRGFSTHGLAEAFITGWKKSPHHRRNLLDPDLTEIGVGVAFSKDSGRYYAVQDFGRPKSDEITFSVTNQSDATVTYSVDGKDFSIKPRYTVTHHRCRPPTLKIQPPRKTDQTEDSLAKPLEFHPHSGSHYLIRSDSGQFTVEED
jgi:uncharacterized protein YkwD